MRAVFLAALVLAAIVPAPAAAQGTHLIEDPAGDTVLAAFINGGAVPSVPFSNTQSQAADLLALDIEEKDDSIIFTVTATAMPDTLAAYSYQIYWTWNKVEFNLNCQRSEFAALGAGSSCFLSAYAEKEGFLDSSFLQPTFDLAAATLRVEVPKVYILDAENKAPTKGDVFKDINVRSRQSVTQFAFAAYATDRMPDTGGESFTLAIGDIAKGHIALVTDDRVRVSNGGATTFIFQGNLTNSAEIEDTVVITLADVPAGYNVTAPDRVRVPAQGSKLVTVLVSTPFGHDHGGYTSFNVSARSQRDPASYATMRLGVLHTPIPQPAGHHDELFLHVAGDGSMASGLFSGATATMSTLEDHTGDLEQATATGTNSGGLVYDIPLGPALAMGLDFDLDRLGAIDGAINGHTSGEATVSAELYLVKGVDEGDQFNRRVRYDLDSGILLATSDEALVTLALNTKTPFALKLTPESDSDYVPYASHQNLVLRIQIAQEGINRFCCFEGATPTLVTNDFKMKLPLNEYHDRLTGIAEAVSSIELKAEGAVQKLARPGTTMTYIFTLTNPGSQATRLEIDVAGNDAALGEVVPNGAVDLGPRQSVKVTLAVAVPAEAQEGHEIEVLVFAHAQDDPNKMAIARTKTTVTKGSEATPDETAVLQAAQNEADNDTPAPGALFVLGAIGVAVLVWRRRS